MKRKSKGQMLREAKLSRKEENRLNALMNDPWFKGLPVPVQLKLTGFVKMQVEEYMGMYETIGYQKGMLDYIKEKTSLTIVTKWMDEDVKRPTPRDMFGGIA